MQKIIVLDGYTLNPGDISWDKLRRLGELKIYDRTPADKVAERIGDAQIVFTNKTPISNITLNICTSIKYIGVFATGYNIVDYVTAKTKNILVTNIPTYGTYAVAQLTIALLLEICHHAGEHSISVKNGKWSASKDFCYWDYPLIELTGKTMGIIGMGRIGLTTAKIAKALGINVVCYDQNINPTLIEQGYNYITIDELLNISDIISLHCPLFPSTEGIINKSNINKMKDGVIIINTSRGPLINEEDLADALNNGKVFAAAVDVVSEEPIRKDNPLLKANNCIITPHIAWAPKETRQRLMDIAVENLNQFLLGKPINVVNL